MHSAELAIVVPVHNEDANIEHAIHEWLPILSREQIDHRFVVVNDGSTDNTLSILKRLQRQFADQFYVLDKPNSGHGRSCRAGYETALQQQARWILQVDSDGQCDPAFFPAFWAKRNEANCILGLRITRDDGVLRRLISEACRIVVLMVTGRSVRDVNVPYRLIERSALERALQKIPAEIDLQNIALSVALKSDRCVRWAYVPIRFRARPHGTSSLSVRKIVRMGFRMLVDLRRANTARASS